MKRCNLIGKLSIRVLAGLVALACLAVLTPVDAHEPTIGLLLNKPGSFEGYTLFGSLRLRQAYLIDNDGKVINSWDVGDGPTAGGSSGYLLEDGSLMSLIKPSPAKVQQLSWDGTQMWWYQPEGMALHHDLEVLPNGNVLLIDRTRRTQDEAILAGRDPATVTDAGIRSDRIIEVEPTGPNSGRIVWEWFLWDHLIQDVDPAQDNFGVVGDHPELIDINHVDPNTAVGSPDWTHSNSIDYNPELDQIMITILHFSEYWVIDHSTTTEEAAGQTGGNSGKGGDILYRWGNPQTYGAGDDSDQILFRPHDARWIDPGLPGEDNILVFNNGRFRPGQEYTSIEESAPPVDGEGNYALTPGEAYGPEAPLWTYSAANPTDFFSTNISGAVRLPNGNTLIASGAHGTFFEVTPEGETVWEYISPITNEGPLAQGDVVPRFQGRPANIVFRAERYAPDYPGLAGRDLTPGDPVETILDSDGDGLPDDEELKELGTDPLLADTDNDGLSDDQELAIYDTDPLIADTDDDGIPDGVEVFLWGTDPLLADTDGDGVPDGVEVDAGFDPVDALSSPVGDVNGNGEINSIDASLILQFESGLLGSVPQPTFADVNGNGDINSIDASLILQLSAGLLSNFPA